MVDLKRDKNDQFKKTCFYFLRANQLNFSYAIAERKKQNYGNLEGLQVSRFARLYLTERQKKLIFRKNNWSFTLEIISENTFVNDRCILHELYDATFR